MTSNPEPQSYQAVAETPTLPLAQTLARESQNDPDLARVLELWAELPEAGRKLLRTTAETLAGQMPNDRRGNP